MMRSLKTCYAAEVPLQQRTESVSDSTSSHTASGTIVKTRSHRRAGVLLAFACAISVGCRHDARPPPRSSDLDEAPTIDPTSEALLRRAVDAVDAAMPPPTTPRWQVTTDGVPLPATRAYSLTGTGAAIDIVFTRESQPCDALENGEAFAMGDVLLGIAVAPALLPSGASEWRVVETRFGVALMRVLHGVRVEAPSTDPSSGAAGWRFDVPFPVAESSGSRTLVIRGPVAAERCGAERFGAPANPRAHGGIASVGGVPFTIRGATVSLDRLTGHQRVSLTSSPSDCFHEAWGRDFGITVSSNGSVSLEGMRIEGQPFVHLEGDPPLGMRVTGIASRNPSAHFDGSVVAGGYTIRLRGDVALDRCPDLGR